eukprot:1180454-Prorocentrum_minimum.AAC.1
MDETTNAARSSQVAIFGHERARGYYRGPRERGGDNIHCGRYGHYGGARRGRDPRAVAGDVARGGGIGGRCGANRNIVLPDLQRLSCGRVRDGQTDRQTDRQRD